MLDDLDRLRTGPALRELLDHYARPGLENRETWQDRLMNREGLEAAQLVKLHGELLAFGWLEQNTGQTPVPRPGAAAGCYRITLAGLRAYKQVRAEDQEEAEDRVAA